MTSPHIAMKRICRLCLLQRPGCFEFSPTTNYVGFRDEHGLSLVFWWICIGFGFYNICLTGFKFHNLVSNFFAKFCSVSGLRITVFNLLSSFHGSLSQSLGLDIEFIQILSLNYDQWYKSGLLCIVSSKFWNWCDLHWSSRFSWLMIRSATRVGN